MSEQQYTPYNVQHDTFCIIDYDRHNEIYWRELCSVRETSKRYYAPLDVFINACLVMPLNDDIYLVPADMFGDGQIKYRFEHAIPLNTILKEGIVGVVSFAMDSQQKVNLDDL